MVTVTGISLQSIVLMSCVVAVVSSTAQAIVCVIIVNVFLLSDIISYLTSIHTLCVSRRLTHFLTVQQCMMSPQ